MKILFMLLVFIDPLQVTSIRLLNLLEYVLTYCSTISNVIFLCGDLNIDYLSLSKQSESLNDPFTCHNLLVTSRESTRVVTNKNRLHHEG